MKWRAKVNVSATGELQRIHSLDPPSVLEIELTNEGYFMNYLDSKGNLLTNGWHPVFEDALKQAEFEFDVSPAEWVKIE
jgi:hypothetical protein